MIPVKSALSLLLEDLDLTYEIRDDVLLITSRTANAERASIRYKEVQDTGHSLAALFTACVAGVLARLFFGERYYRVRKHSGTQRTDHDLPSYL